MEYKYSICIIDDLLIVSFAGMRRKLIVQEDEFRLQQSTLISELNKVRFRGLKAAKVEVLEGGSERCNV